MHPSRTITKCHLRRNSVNHLISSTNVETTYRRRKPHKRGVRRLGLSWFLFFCEVSKRRFKIEQRCCLLEAAGAYWLVQLASLLLMGDTCQQRPARSEQSVRKPPNQLSPFAEICSFDVRVVLCGWACGDGKVRQRQLIKISRISQWWCLKFLILQIFIMEYA